MRLSGDLSALFVAQRGVVDGLGEASEGAREEAWTGRLRLRWRGLLVPAVGVNFAVKTFTVVSH